MSTFGPLVRYRRDPTDLKRAGCHAEAWERSRLEWRFGSPGDPASLLQGFLAEQGITLSDVARLPSVTDHHESDVCGAAVLIAPGGAPTPAPAVPDLVCVVYGHRP